MRIIVMTDVRRRRKYSVRYQEVGYDDTALYEG